ncbi:MAG: hypothetical protein P8Z78_01745 [Gammaproteobacteria bacterium]|jgi:hypothetical protein
MKYPLLLIGLLVVSAPGAEEYDLSLPEQPKSEFPAQDSSIPMEVRDTELGSRCMEMSRKIEELKGRPQRKAAMEARFEAECRKPPQEP